MILVGGIDMSLSGKGEVCFEALDRKQVWLYHLPPMLQEGMEWFAKRWPENLGDINVAIKEYKPIVIVAQVWH